MELLEMKGSVPYSVIFMTLETSSITFSSAFVSNLKERKEKVHEPPESAL